MSANRKPSICITQEGNVIRAPHNVYHMYMYNSPVVYSSLTTAGVAKTNMLCLFCTDATVASTEPYKYQYTLTFNVGRLSHKKHHPNYAELFLHIVTDDHNPAQIKIVSNHLQQPITWTKPALQANGSETAEVRIHLTSLANSSLWRNSTTLTITVASTNTIRIPSENHHQTALGLVLYMGGAPEVIDELLETPIADHTLKQMDSNKRSTTGSTPCQLKRGFKVKFAEVKYGYDKILRPEEVDIGRCVGECPHLLHHLYNPTDHATVRNILAFQEGSGETNISTASCVPTTFKPLPVVLFNSNGITQKVLHNMVATSCGCR